MVVKWLFALTVVLSNIAQASAVDLNVTDSERATLPPYCALNHPLYQVHLCNGINFINRTYRERDKSSQSFSLGQALGELNYVVTHFGRDFPLYSEAFINRGTVYSLQKNWSKASQDWQTTIDLNPKSVMAYVYLADHYSKFKMNKQALDIVTTGLTHNPEAKILKRKYDKLGGKQPYPAPIAAESGKVDAIADKQDEARNAAASPPKDVASTDSTATPIGSPTNPWCRFCTDTPAAPPAPTPAMPGAIPRAAP